MSRIHKNWLRAFCEQFKDTEVPPTYAIWSGIWTLSCMLGNEVSIKRGSIDIHPNMYIWLIGPPRNGKGYAGQTGMKMLQMVPFINTYGGNMSTSFMTKLMDRLRKDNLLDPSKRLSLALFSDELSQTVGVGEQADSFLRLMTQLYSSDYQYGTHLHGPLTAKGSSVHWLALTTQSWLKRCIPPDLIDSGFASRLITIVEPLSTVIQPSMAIADPRIFAHLLVDLTAIMILKGTYALSAKAEKIYNKWYEENKRKRIAIKDEITQAIYGREDESVLKTAMCLMASSSDSFEITEGALQNSIKLVETARRNSIAMLRALAAGDTLIQLKNYLLEKLELIGQPIAHTKLLRMTSSVVPDSQTFRRLITTLKEEGLIIELKGSSGRGVWYAPLSLAQAAEDNLRNALLEIEPTMIEEVEEAI